MKGIFLVVFLSLCISVANCIYGTYTRGSGIARCFYGERGSLTATCENASSSYFRATTYRFDSLDETLRCVNCNLDVIPSNAFDISGNHILNLDLRNSNITQLASSSFVGLVYMEQLDLSNNNIKTIIPGTFKGIKKLDTLSIAFNKITMLVNGAFSELGNLTMLYLNDNEIASVDSGAFDKLGSLKMLYLQNNKIKHFENSSMGLSKIELLNLENNDIINLLPEDINSTTLLDLNLARNKLKILSEGTIIAPLLAMLNISSNQIETISPLAFKGCMRLEYLDLQNNKLKVLEQNAFMRLYSLRNINLAYNNLTALQTSVFTHLPELRYLNVSYNKINAIMRRGVLPMHSLHTLDISHNNLSYFDFKLLFDHAQRLVLVHLENNNIPCYIVKDMMEYFKYDSIEFSMDDRFTKKDITCNTTATKPSEYEYDYKDTESRTDKLVTALPNSSSPNVYIIYSFLFIIIGLIVVLFYLQYKTYLNLKYGHQGGGDIAQVGLMSSRGLESRDNDY